MSVVDLADFSGGVNLRDSPEQLSRNETPDARNLTLSTRGAVLLRNGHTNVLALPGGTTNPAFIFYSEALDKWLCGRRSDATHFDIYERPGNLTGSWVSKNSVVVPSVSQDWCGFVDFPGTTPQVVITRMNQAGKLPVTSASGHTATWDGTTYTVRSTEVFGEAIALWQNRVWVAGRDANDAFGNPSRLYYSAVGDPATWSSTGQFLDIREKDASRILALGNAGGALIVFKKRSTYRVTDIAAFQMIDPGVGCVGSRAVTAYGGVLYLVGADSIYACDGVGPLLNIGDKLRPEFGNGQSVAQVIAHLGRVVVFYQNQAAGGVYELVEFYPPSEGEGVAFMLHRFASSGTSDWVSSFALKADTLYAAIQNSDRLFTLFSTTPGADDGVNFTGYIKSPALNLGKLHRLQRVRVYGKSASSATSTKQILTYKDWSSSVSDTFDITTALETADGEEVIDLQALGHAEAFQLEFRVSGGTGTAELDRLTLELTPLAR